MANDMMSVVCLVSTIVFVLCVSSCDGSPPSPDQGFYLVTNLPERGRRSGDIYMYALHTTGVERPGWDGNQIEFSKEGGLPPAIVETGLAGVQDLVVYGCYLRVRAPRKMRGVRYGHYTADFIPKQDSPYEGPEDRYTFVKPQSKLLNTRGVYTVTIYPSAGDTSLSEDSPTSVGVAWSPGCNKIQWSKGGRRNVNTGPRLDLKSTEDAGLYTIRRGSRGKRGWFVQIRVIVADCPPGEFYGVNAGACTPRTVPCLNGGVPKSRSGECTCPPLFLGSDCTEVANYPGFGDFPLGSTQGPWLQCGDLPGGNRECKGYLFCYGDLYGCTCGPGWHGNNCDKPCPKGKWGADCNQRCPADNTDCDRFFGEKITTEISM